MNGWLGRRRDSTAQTAPKDSEIVNELLSRETHGFDSANSPKGLINHQELLARVTQGFDRANSP
jgi:hypothetical protein